MNPLVMSIINNPSSHQVNRAEKHERTIEVMANNLIKKAEQGEVGGMIASNSNNRGYGQGRKMGD